MSPVTGQSHPSLRNTSGQRAHFPKQGKHSWSACRTVAGAIFLKSLAFVIFISCLRDRVQAQDNDSVTTAIPSHFGQANFRKLPGLVNNYQSLFKNGNPCSRNKGSECYTYQAPDGQLYNTQLITIDCSSILEDKCGGGLPADNGTAIVLGFLLPRNNGENIMLGALTWAIFQANRNSTDISFKFCAEESGEAGKFLAMRKMTAMRSHGVKAFIGPDESCMSEAVLAAAWDMPMITYKCPDQRVSDKALFPTFARTMPPSSKYSKFVIALLQHYKWQDIIVIAGKKPSWEQIVEALEDLAKEFGIRVTEKYYLPAEYTSKDSDEIINYAKLTYAKTRVYVFVADNEALIDFVRYMDKLGHLKNGEYVIISVDDEILNEKDVGQYIMKAHDKDPTLNETMALPFRSVLKLTPSPPTDPNFDVFMDTVRNLSTISPFNVPQWPSIFGKPHVPIYAAHIYDAVTIFAKAMNHVNAEGLDPTNVTHIMSKIFNTMYRSIQGFDVFIDEHGDAEGNFTVLGLVKDDSSTAKRSMKPVWKFYPGPSSSKLPILLAADNEVDWLGGKPPENQPACGFDNEKCDKELDWKTIIICAVIVFLVVAGIFGFKHYRYEQKLACLLWKIDYREIYPISSESEQPMSKKAPTKYNQERSWRGSFLGALPTDNNYSEHNAYHRKAFTKVGKYKGEIVAIKCINKRNIDLTRNIRKELKQIREMRHDNINTFIGACVDPPNICIITTYCARGSLEDAIKNEDLHFDNMLVASLVADLLRGMIYLHDSEIQSHGNLKSSNCLVDSKLVLQITDFGLHEFKANQEEKLTGPPCDKGLLFRAPELLRMANPPPQGSSKGDVYSFAIILHHVITRQDPFVHLYAPNIESNKVILDIISRIKNPSLNDGSSGEYCRPRTRGINCLESVVRCMLEAWDENPETRPDFRMIRNKLKEMQAGLKPNIFDNMMAVMEKYAMNLEGMVEERTQQLREEKGKTDTLLHRMLPKTVAESLIRGHPVEAESFNMVTIYFSDIVGFTTLSAESTPLEVVDLLNDLYTACDRIIGRFDVYKIETIGDAYMVVSGLPIRNRQTHAREIAKMALALLEKIKNFKIKHKPYETLKLRIGIHSGPCVAGVVGLKMPRYCLFGDTVNTASRMESTGEALKIHVSEACKTILDSLGGFILKERGLIPVKGKGEMRTFWLIGEDPSTKLKNETQACSHETANFDNLKNDAYTKDDLNSLINVTYTCQSNNRKTSSGLGVRESTVIEDLDPSSPTSSLLESPLLSLKRKQVADPLSPKNFLSQVTSKMMRKCTNGTLGNCSSNIQECKENLLNEVKKNGHVMGKYKAAPIIPSKNESYV